MSKIEFTSYIWIRNYGGGVIAILDYTPPNFYVEKSCDSGIRKGHCYLAMSIRLSIANKYGLLLSSY